MKKYYLGIILLFVMGFFVGTIAGLAVAEEGQEEQISYSWGKVSTISSNQITVKEYDYDAAETETTYTVDPNAELKNIDSLTSIAVGDNVEIDYVIMGEEKIAKVIAVEKLSQAEELEGETSLGLPEEELEYPAQERE